MYNYVLKYRYESIIPRNINQLLNKVPSTNTIIKKPSPLVKYLIFSNIASYIYYNRLWNGELFI
jgi:hypothetical protein